MEIEKIEGENQSVQVASELSARLGGPPPFAGETDLETVGDSTYRARYSFRVF